MAELAERFDVSFETIRRDLKALEKEHCTFDNDAEYILKNGTGSYKKDRHVALVYGDYYFIEAIYKLKGFTTLFW